jgi:aminocarboxymuconate-semialdehyde decarboxylase
LPVIDTHAHVTPEKYKEAIRRDETWHGLDAIAGEIHRPDGFNKNVATRLEEMDATGIDMQLVTPTVGFYQYDNDLDVAQTIARECNEFVAEMVGDHPTRFAGLATIPMQDIPAALAELRYGMEHLGLVGAIISDHVNGRTYDRPEFLEFFRGVEELGAILHFHQGGGGIQTVVHGRQSGYSLPNGIGNLADRTITFASLVFGGVMDACPNLKLLLAHGGGYTALGIGRLDKVAGAFEGSWPDGALTPPFAQPESQYALTRPPSSYLSEFHYDCCTYDGDALRFLIDKVGIDQVMLGTDYPAPMLLIDSVNWVRSLPQLTQAEKEAILNDNPTRFLGL